jgi:signal transduction histidine kinase
VSASVRSRIVAAFVATLGAAVIVMGGAAARVGTANALDNAQARLSQTARDEQRLLDARATEFLNRAALGSAVLARVGPSASAVSALRTSAFPDADVFAFVRPDGTVVGTNDPGAGSPPVRDALGGTGATGVVPTPGGAVVFAAQPVLRSGAPVGALAVGIRVTPGALAELARDAAPAATAELLGPDGAIVRSGAGPAARFDLLGSRSFVSGRAELGRTGSLVSLARLTLSRPAAVALVLPVSAAAETATSFPRALIGGVLVAALLAVVLALWLASRITRPILSLADEAERVKSDFLATVSHELRTPLTPIRGYTDLLRRGRVPRGRAAEYLDEIGEAAARMERIVTLLVEVAATEAGRFVPEIRPVAPAALLTPAAERWTARAPRHRFSVRAAKSLPKVGADERAISRVIDELVDNAVKFSPDGGPVELRADRSGDAVRFTVADRGIGLDPEALERLSAAFVQAEPGETRRFGGLGLGLTYAARVLAAHDATLAVEGTKAGGTSFSFSLPSISMVSRMSGRDKSETTT